MVKVTLRKCPEQLCESPALKQCPCTTSECHPRPPSSRGAWECREPAAPDRAHSQELFDDNSDTGRAVCPGTAAPCLLACSTRCTRPALIWRQKPSEQSLFAVARREVSLHYRCSALLKTSAQLGKYVHRQALFFLSQGLQMYQVQ